MRCEKTDGLVGVAWADYANLLRHAHDKALLFDFVRLDGVVILKDLACGAVCQQGVVASGILQACERIPE